MDYFNMWESQRSVSEVILSMLAMTDSHYSFSYKKVSYGETEYKVLLLHSRYSYEPPTVKGVIKENPDGCSITAELIYTASRVNNVLCLFMCVFYFAVGISAFFADFYMSFIVAIFTILLSSGIAASFFYTRWKYQSPELVYKMISAAAGSEYKRHSSYGV